MEQTSEGEYVELNCMGKMLERTKIYVGTVEVNESIFMLAARWTLLVHVSDKKGNMYGVKSHANLIYVILNFLMSINSYLNCELESYSTEIQYNFNSKLKYLEKEKILLNRFFFFFVSFLQKL